MLYDGNEKFDLQVKAMLEDAEEKVPSRVWSAVSGRIGSGKAEKPIFWRWAGAVAACTAVAAVAAVLFVRTPETGIITSPAVLSGPAVAELAEEEVPFQNLEIQKISKYLAVASGIEPGIGHAAETSAEIVPETVQTAEEIETIAVVPAEQPAASPHQESNSLNNMFASLEDDVDVRKERRISITLDGALLGNDSESAGNSRPWMGGNGAGTGLQELSTSTFNIPLSFGLGLRFGVSDRLSIGTGLGYTLLSRKFNGSYQGHIGETTHTLQYIGIPLNVYFDIFHSNSIGLYAFAGGTAEYCISNRYIHDNGIIKDPVKGLQYSIAAGLGVEFKITDYFGIYIDPSVRYYFDCKQPTSIRTVQPLMLSFEAGLRFDL